MICLLINLLYNICSLLTEIVILFKISELVSKKYHNLSE